MPAATFVTIPFSHYCEKARWALDHARVAYREEGHAPGLHRRATRKAGGRHTVPVLVTEGRVLDDSPLIVEYAHAQAPEDRKLFPANGTARDEVLAWQARFDRDLGPHLRRFGYFHLLPRRAVALKFMLVGIPPLERYVLRVSYPLLRAGMRRYMRIDEKNALASRNTLHRVFDAVSELLADGRKYLVGDRFTAADLTFAALAGPALLPPEAPFPIGAIDDLPEPLVTLHRELAASPAGTYALRLYREHRRAAD
jgi:glutathione S-transferase